MEQKACVPAKAVTAKASHGRSQWHSLGNAMWLLITLFISKISSKKSPEVLLPAGTKCKTNTHRESQVVLAHVQVWPPRDVFTVPFPAGSAGNRDFCLIVFYTIIACIRRASPARWQRTSGPELVDGKGSTILAQSTDSQTGKK